MTYTHPHLWINGRTVPMKDVADAKATAHTEFETETFAFIHAWLNGTQQFTLQTSGSTGTPKVISVTRQQLIASAKLTEEALGLMAHHHTLICLNTKYIAGKMMIVRCMVTNMKMFAIDPCSNPLYKVPIDQRIHFAAFVPYQITNIVESKHPHLLDSLFTVIIGGAPLSEFTQQRLQKFSCNIYATYGMTETLTHIALQRVNGKHATEHFKTLPTINISTDDRSCLVIEAPHLEEKVITNDVVEIIGYNQFKWIGRWDNIINTGGIKVSPEKIETAIEKILTRLNLNCRFFVSAIPDQQLGEKVVLFIEGKTAAVSSWKNNFVMLMQSIQPYERPKEIHVIENFTLTETEKINRLESSKSSKSILPLS